MMKVKRKVYQHIGYESIKVIVLNEKESFIKFRGLFEPVGNFQIMKDKEFYSLFKEVKK
jgi:hypothetical protein